MSWTKYDPIGRKTWPPVSGEDVLVCYRVPAGFTKLTVTWANNGSDADYVGVYGADWIDVDVQSADEIMWRPLTEADYPSEMPGRS